jgi:hypothetical protein
MLPVLNAPPIAVSVWITVSLFVTLMVAPGVTVNFIGENIKFEILMEYDLGFGDACAL